MTNPLHILVNLSSKIFNENIKICPWQNSIFETLNKLKNDHSGKVGELFIETLCINGDINHEYKGDTLSKDGTYDIIINNKKIEIKTAKIGIHNSFQHENIRTDGYDYLIFLDITPSNIYITILPKFDLKIKSNIFERTPHLRKGSSDVYKIDFNIKILEKMIIKNNSLKISDKTDLEEIYTFIENLID